MTDDSDPFGDKAYLAGKRKKPRPASLDPLLEPHHETLEDLGPEAAEMLALSPVERAKALLTKEQISYRFLDGHSEVISSRTLAAIELCDIERMRGDLAGKALGLSRQAMHRALTAPKALRVKEDMLARLKKGAPLYAWFGLAKLARSGTKEDGVKLGALNSILDRIEGKAIQRSIEVSAHVETVRFIVDAGQAPSPEAVTDMVKDAVTGRWISKPKAED